MISHKHKFIYIHIPKCGGCSLKDYLRKHCPDKRQNTQHNSLGVVLKENSKDIQDYYKFTFVRNPWCRLVSLYYFWFSQTQKSVFYKWDFKQVDFIKDNGLSFIDFIHVTNSNDSVFHQKPHLKPYIGFFMDDPSSFDFIGKIENYQEDFGIICDKIGVPKEQIPHSNRSKHKHYTEYYDDEARSIVAEKYAKDIEYFGYKFGE